MQVTMEYNNILSYITYINRTPIIQTLSLFNDTESSMDNISVSIQWDHPIVDEWSQSEISLEPEQTLRLNFENDPLRVIGKEFISMTEGYQTSFKVMVNRFEEILYEKYFDADVLAYNQWLGSNYHPTLIASFVTPNHPQVVRIVKNAADILGQWGLSFSDYQTQDVNDIRAQIKAIYLSIQSEGVHYVTIPPSFEKSGQRIRFVDDVMTNKMGNCIELAILFASCLEYVQLNPLIIFLDGHAFVGCWLEDQAFLNTIDDDVTSLTKRLSKGMQLLELVESTCLTSEHPVSYEEAVERGQEQILYGNKFLYLLDVVKARLLGVKPVPQRIDVLSTEEEVYNNTTQENSEDVQGISMPETLENMEDIEIVTRRKRSRLQIWESKLLNLTLRNNLLNFRPTRKSVSILEGNLNLLEDYLSSGKEFSLVPCPTEIEIENRRDKEYSYTRSLKDAYREYMNSEMKNKRLVTLLKEKDLFHSIKELYYAARTELEENGANTLFVAMGFLKWYESDVSKLPRYAPILLYPVEMVRKSSSKGYVIRYSDEEVQINTTLLEKLRMELNLEFPGLDPLPMDDHGINVKMVLNTMRSAVLYKKGWDIIDISYIGLFSFNQFVMWNDIHSKSEELMDNKIVGSLMQGKLDFETEEIVDSKDIDNTDMFFKNAILMEADSSQLTAVYSASKGSSFVLHGPPGTGKSQTITNIIASALYNGKSVLFVAEKMAALNVVQSRLEELGIGDFALEIHSNKAKKKEVLSRIGKILEKGDNGVIKEIQEKREKLYQLRIEIKESNDALHSLRDNGYSIYEMIGIYESQHMDDVYPIGDLALNLTKKKVDDIGEVVDRYLLAYEEVVPINDNPLNFINVSTMSMKESNRLKDSIVSLKDYLVDLQEKLKEVKVEIPEDTSFLSIKKLLDLFNTILGIENLSWYHVEHWRQEDMDTTIYDIVEKGFQRRNIRDELLNEFNPGILKFDAVESSLIWEQSNQKWFMPKILEQNKILKSLKVHSNAPKTLKKENVGKILEQLCTYGTLGDEIDSYMNIHDYKFQPFWNGEDTNWEQFHQSLQSTEIIITLLRELKQVNHWLDIGRWINDLRESWMIYKDQHKDSVEKAFTSVQNTIANLKEVNEFSQGEIFTESSAIYDMLDKVQRVVKIYSGVDQWVVYVKSRNEFEDLNLSNFVQLVESGELDSENMKPVLMKSLMYYSIIEILEQETYLSNFNRRNFEYLLKQYKEELEIVSEMTRLELIEKLVSNIPKPFGGVNVNSGFGMLKKAVKNNARGLSLRKLFNGTSDVLRRIAPCMLMSPISIAQYIDPSFPKFDLVIFDEASQVNTHEAIGAIARGEQLIVVGDPNQLPPTSFFSGSIDEEELEFEEMDQDSILDECQAIMFPELHLKWHYRSSHESLIAFSNSQYYDNQLYTFPSYNDLESKVRLVEVEGFYDRGGTKENIAEAETIIEEVQRRLLEPSLRDKSIGIVTFSSIQQKLIQNKLDELFSRYPKLEEYAQGLKEEIFVKNLENVQGDERDIILFSVGYGPDKNGKVTMNFGPLNQSMGWKRLNVVVSRSREEMIVYSTLKSEQIDLSRTSAEGVLGLKRFLEFAKNKSALMIDYYDINLRKDEMIDVIAARLEELGYSIVKRVGKSNYRIDLGIVNPKVQNEFMAAIVIDGYQYYNIPTIRDKVVVQPTMLQRLKWNVINVWTLDWFKNKNDVMETIKARLSEIQRTLDSSINRIQNDGSESPSFKIEYINAVNQERVFYEPYKVQENQYSQESFYQHMTVPEIRKIMNEIIDFEAPIVEEDLFRRVMRVWGISQLGSRVQRILKSVAENTEAFCNPEDHKNTYWQNREAYENGTSCRRYKDEKRKFQYICDEEIQATILEVLSEQVSLDLDNLCREVFKLHGYNRLGTEARKNVEDCLNGLLRNNEVILIEGRYITS